MNLQSYLSILRPIDGGMAAFAVLIGFVLGIGGLTLTQPLLLAMASVFIFSGAGIVLNDYFDAEMDKVNAPNRPIPSGKITKKNALIYSATLFIIAIALAFLINTWCLALALLNTVLEILYAWKFKKIALLGNFTDSWFPASSFLYGALASGNLASVPILAGLAFLANTGREIHGDLEDIEGDKKENAKTLPLLIGEKKSLLIANAFTSLAVILSVVPWFFGLLNLNYLIVVLVADVVFVYSMFVSPKKNQKLTKIAMILAMLAFVAGLF